MKNCYKLKRPTIGSHWRQGYAVRLLLVLLCPFRDKTAIDSVCSPSRTRHGNGTATRENSNRWLVKQTDYRRSTHSPSHHSTATTCFARINTFISIFIMLLVGAHVCMFAFDHGTHIHTYSYRVCERERAGYTSPRYREKPQGVGAAYMAHWPGLVRFPFPTVADGWSEPHTHTGPGSRVA